MAAPNVCPKCGFTNQPGWTFCSNCGSPLPPSPGTWAGPTAPTPGYPGQPPAAGYPAYAGYPPVAYGPPPWEAERRKQIQHTRSGVLLLLIGALLSWIPYIGPIGGFLTLIGAILVIVGRKAFGEAHRRNVAISIVLFIVGIIVVAAGVVVGTFAVLSAVQGPTPNEAALASALQNAFTLVLYITAVAYFIFGIASVLFTYALQKSQGRVLLWAAFGATVGLQIAIVIVALPLIPGIAATAAHQIVTGSRDSAAIANAFSGASTGLQLFSVVPSLLYAAANYLAWDRINKGEIPAQPLPPAMPGATPPMSPPAPPINPI